MDSMQSLAVADTQTRVSVIALHLPIFFKLVMFMMLEEQLHDQVRCHQAACLMIKMQGSTTAWLGIDNGRAGATLLFGHHGGCASSWLDHGFPVPPTVAIHVCRGSVPVPVQK